jgi:hypothetical protein
MKKRVGRHLMHVSLVVAGLVSVVACANTTRVATLNRQTPGPTIAATLEKQLAVRGFPGARVFCQKRLVVNVGATHTCAVTGAGTNRAVEFTFGSYAGSIRGSSVKVS